VPGPLLCALLFGFSAARPGAAAHAAPLDDPHIGGFTFSGPTSGTLAAVYWNPAALGLVRGLQVMISGTVRVARTNINRTPINSMTGLPTTSADPFSMPTGSVSATDTTDPRQWPTGPGGFFGISTDFGGDRFTLGFASYSPFVEQAHFPASAAGDEPTRYFRLDADLRHLALVPALAVRIGSELRIGVAPGFLFSTGRLSFAETGMGGQQVESSASDARYNIDSGQSITDSRVSFTLGLGAYYRTKSFEFGLAYSSRPFGTDVNGIEIGAEHTTVTGPGGTPVTCAGQTDRCVFGDIVYRLPDVWTAGITWHAPLPGLEVSLIERWIWFHVQDRIDIRLTSPGLQAAGLPDQMGLPDHIVFHRGLHDVWDTRLRVAYWLREGLRIGAGLRVETSAVDAADVNPAAVDGFKIEPMVLMEAHLTRRLALAAGYGFTYMPSVTVNPSNFDPTAAGTCASANQDLTNPACVARLDGRARPTAAGVYGRTVHDFSLALTAYF